MFRLGLALVACALCVKSVFASGHEIIHWLAPTEVSVSWKGLLPTEGGAVKPGQSILYPTGGAGLAGLVAAIATHAAIVDKQQADDQKQARTAADRALDPFQDFLSKWTHDELWRSVASADSARVFQVVDATALKQDNIRLLKTTATYSISLDYRVLILDLQANWTEQRTKSVSNTRTVRVISTPLKVDDHRSYWTEGDGTKTKATAVAMLHHAILLADSLEKETDKNSSVPAQSVRYLFGDAERIERAQIVRLGCARIVLRDLRDRIVSVPQKNDEAQGCTSTYRF